MEHKCPQCGTVFPSSERTESEKALGLGGAQAKLYMNKWLCEAVKIYCDDTIPSGVIEIREGSAYGRLLGKIINVGM